MTREVDRARSRTIIQIPEPTRRTTPPPVYAALCTQCRVQQTLFLSPSLSLSDCLLFSPPCLNSLFCISARLLLKVAGSSSSPPGGGGNHYRRAKTKRKNSTNHAISFFLEKEKDADTILSVKLQSSVSLHLIIVSFFLLCSTFSFPFFFF